MFRRIGIILLCVLLGLFLIVMIYLGAGREHWIKLTHETPFAEMIAAAAVPETPAPEAPDIVIIVLDTERFDEVFNSKTMRAMQDEFKPIAEKARVYRHAYSTSCWTLPSHVSMMSGLYPNAHKADQRSTVIGNGFPVLAELLGQNGYFTAGLIENPVLADYSRFSRGFSIYDETFKRLPAKPEDERKNLIVPNLISELIGAQKFADAPWFLTLNFINAHWPYTPAKRLYNQRAMGVSYSKLIDRQYDFTIPNWYLGRVKTNANELRKIKRLHRLEADECAEKTAAVLKLLDEGRKRKRIVFILADHGESLGDHGQWDHVFQLTTELVHVPLMVFGDGIEPGIVDEPVSLADIFPTVLRLAGVHAPPCDGRDLLDSLSPNRPIFMSYEYPEQVLSTFPIKDRLNDRIKPYLTSIRGVIKDGWILVDRNGKSTDLYDLNSDPTERNNLLAAEMSKAAELEFLLQTYVIDTSAGKESTPKVMDKQTKEALQSLGYLN